MELVFKCLARLKIVLGTGHKIARDNNCVSLK